MRKLYLFGIGLMAAIVFAAGLNGGTSPSEALACDPAYYACPPDDSGTGGDTGTSGSPCITCNGGSMDLAGAATSIGQVVSIFDAPTDGDNVNVDQAAEQYNVGGSEVELFISTDGTFYGAAHALQSSLGTTSQSFASPGGGAFNLSSGMSSYAGAATLLTSDGSTANSGN